MASARRWPSNKGLDGEQLTCEQDHLLPPVPLLILAKHLTLLRGGAQYFCPMETAEGLA